MQTVARSQFTSIKTEGAILPADLLQRLNEGELDGLKPEQYHLSPNERLNEAINRAWNRCQGVWQSFQELREKLPLSDSGTSLTRERWLLILFQELGYGRLPFQAGGLELQPKSEQVGLSPETRYPISHVWEHVPIHLVTFRQELDKRDPASKRSPHSLVQEFLSRSEDHLWGIVSNGLNLRVLRDNVSLTRAAYLEFDLEAMMTGAHYADFSLLWLICHQSRFEVRGEGNREWGVGSEDAIPDSLPPTPSTCWLELWSQAAAEQGTRALDALREGVQEAIAALGRGFLAHPANAALRQSLASGALSQQVYYRQLLRLVYRLIFLFVAEDRNLLLHPDATPLARQRYMAYYSVGRLRQLAGSRRSGPHPDLYRAFRLVCFKLRTGYPELGLPALGSFLFSARATPDLDEADMANSDWLNTIRALAFTFEGQVRRPVDYKNLGTEELGSVYESLLELHPQLNLAAATFHLNVVAGSERKTTGSYYTPASLINSLLDSALEPVVADRLRGVGSREGGVGSRGRKKDDSGGAVVSRFEGVAGEHERGRHLLRTDEGVSPGRDVRNDEPDSARGRVRSSEHSRGARSGDISRVHALSPHRSGVSQGTGDTSDSGGTGETKHYPDDPARADTVRGGGQDATGFDSSGGKEEGVGSGEWGIGSERPYSLPPTPYSPLEQVILSIRVVDPACGSGHFLIAAARRLARHLARIQTGDDEPGPEAVRHALREVVQHCIYGVDINEMSVELCKVGLWLETLDPGRPLSFLDKNIQCGNSLIGATPALLARGIPDEAFTPITGDDKSYASEYRKQNSKEKGQLRLFGAGMQPWQRLGNLAQALTELDRIETGTLAGVAQQENAYAAYVGSSDYAFNKLWADAWCAAFMWRKQSEHANPPGFPYPLTESIFRQIERNPHAIPGWVRQEIERLAGQYQFFHWHLAFPQVFRPREDLTGLTNLSGLGSENITGWTGGFDVVLGNPPWEKINLKDEEFFALSYPEIAGAANKAKRKQLIDGLRKTDPNEYERYQQAQAKQDYTSNFFRYSAHFPLTGVSRINLYSAFTELALQIIASIGRVGLVIASGIATDDNNKVLFEELVQNQRLVSIWDFENRAHIFPDVDSRYKFCLFCASGSDGNIQEADFAFYLTHIQQLKEPERRFTLSPLDLKAINPNTKTAPTFRNKREAELTKSIYRRIQAWCLHEVTENWPGNPKTPFNMSNDSGLFVSYPELLQKEATFDSLGCAVIGKTKHLPLYEAKFIHQFNHRYSTFDENTAVARELTTMELINPICTIRPQYWLEESLLKERYSGNWFLAYRMITNATNEKTSIMTILPERPCGNSLTLIEAVTAPTASILCSNMNSFVQDYVARQKVPGTNFNHWIWKQLPVPSPNQVSNMGKNFGLSHSSDWLLWRFLELTYTAYDLQPFAQDCGYFGPPFRWDEERRFLLRCELDAAYFHLYGIPRDDVAYIMDTFPIVRRKDEAVYGEYRTRRVILEIYDAMSEATRTGQPYQTRLDPPPADPRAAHPWDETYLGPTRDPSTWWREVTIPEEKSAPTIKDPGPVYEVNADTTLTLQPPPAPAKSKRQPPSDQSPVSQSPLLTDFTPPKGERSQRLKQVMALAQPKNTTELQTLVAALGDEDESIRWLAGSSLSRLPAVTLLPVLRAFMRQPLTPTTQEEVRRVLRLLSDLSDDETAQADVEQLLNTLTK